MPEPARLREERVACFSHKFCKLLVSILEVGGNGLLPSDISPAPRSTSLPEMWGEGSSTCLEGNGGVRGALCVAAQAFEHPQESIVPPPPAKSSSSSPQPPSPSHSSFPGVAGLEPHPSIPRKSLVSLPPPFWGASSSKRPCSSSSKGSCRVMYIVHRQDNAHISPAQTQDWGMKERGGGAQVSNHLL